MKRGDGGTALRALKAAVFVVAVAAVAAELMVDGVKAAFRPYARAKWL